jgi:hypothetical protein
MTEFDKLFKDNLKDGKVEAPSFVWDNIENEIEEEKRKKGLFFFFRSLSILVVLLSLGFVYWVIDDLSQETYFEAIVSEPNSSSKQPNQILKPIGFDDSRTAIYSKKNQGDIDKNNINKKKSYVSENLSTNINRVEDIGKGLLLSEEKEGDDNAVEDIGKGLLLSEEKEGDDNAVEYIEKGLLLSEEKEGDDNAVEDIGKGLLLSEEKEGDDNAVEDIGKGLLLSEETEGDDNAAEDIGKGLLLSEGKEENGNGAEDIGKGLLLSEGKEENGNGVEDIGKGLLLEDERIDSMFIENKDLTILLTGEVAIENAPRKNKPKKTPFFIEAKVGYSSYKMSLWNSSFVFGDLSNRKFKSSGLNANVSFGYQINALLNPIIGFNYNRKQAEFNYSALYDDEGYLTYNIQGNEMPLDEINDSDLLCNQFILNDIKAVFNITSFSVTVGNRFNLLQLKKIGIDLDLSYSLEVSSNIDVESIDKIDVSENLREHFNSKIAAGLNINYQLSKQFKLFVQAEYIFKPYNSNNFHRSDAHELINSLGVRFNFWVL